MKCFQVSDIARMSSHFHGKHICIQVPEIVRTFSRLLTTQERVRPNMHECFWALGSSSVLVTFRNFQAASLCK